MPRRDQAGTGMLGTVLGAGVFVLLMLFAVQVLVGLYATSVVTAATYDAAKAVAGADAGPSPAVLADAERNAAAQLGSYGAGVRFTWDAPPTGEVVRLTARAPRPTFLPRALTGAVGLDDIVRTVQVRRERVR